MVTDLDNTLLRRDKSISDYTARILRMVQDHRVLVGFATSRSLDTSVRFVEKIRPDITIFDGGATIMQGNEILHQSIIARDTVTRILKKCLHPEIKLITVSSF
jgi:hydroxymethylpyrimidine pyrophosphatase-like HAD family hydrolase